MLIRICFIVTFSFWNKFIVFKIRIALIISVILLLPYHTTAHDHSSSTSLTKVNWSFKSPFSTFNRADLQRGFQVYKEVCSACHGIKYIAFRNLKALGYNEAEIKALAALSEVTDGPNQEGKMFQRPALPKDHFPSPFPNEQAARAANNGALPPDLSLIVKARVGGPDYIYSLLTGYVKPLNNIHIDEGRHYNNAFPGNQIAMPQPLKDDQVTYKDGTKATIEQMAKDVTTFLAFTAEPELEERRQLGVKVLLYLIIMTGIFYAAKRRIWKNIKH